MLSDRGRLMICIPRFSKVDGRLRTVGRAVVRIAEGLGADIEVSQKKNVLSIWVYYKKDGEEEVPVYFDWDRDWNEDAVLHTIASKLYGLSPYPEKYIPQVARSMVSHDG